jgi:hypothetical protein
MKVNHKKYACFDYLSKESTKFDLGDVVIKKTEDSSEIGVILQIHDEFEYRTDMFGNCDYTEIKMATNEEIKQFRPSLLDE